MVRVLGWMFGIMDVKPMGLTHLPVGNKVSTFLVYPDLTLP